MTKTRATLAGLLAVLLTAIGMTVAVQNSASGTGSHNWTYNVSCEGVSGDRPNADSVDSNIRIKNLDTNTVQTFNYHGSDHGSSGAFHYTLANYGVTWTHFEIQWVQVNGTNYHWEGNLECGDTPDEFTPYETDVCWTMSSSDGVENTYQFPQTRGCEPPPCEVTVEQQHDTYWVRSADKEADLADLIILNSPADDAPFEPHDYYSVILTGGACETPPPTDEPTPTMPPTEPPVTDEPTPTPTVPGEPTPTVPPTTEPPAPTSPPSSPVPPVVPPATPPTVGPPSAHESRRCIDKNTIKMSHSDGTVDFVNDRGVCDQKKLPPLKETGF